MSIDEISEQRPLASKEALQHQSAFFAEAFMTRHLLDAMPGMVVVLNSCRQIVFANRVFYQLCGWSEGETLTGKFLGDVISCHIALDSETGCGTGDACTTCGALVAMLSGLSGEDSVQECTLTRRNEAVVENLTLRVWSAPFFYGNETFALLAGMDISHERRRLALEKTFFHDILNLVGSIRGFAELIEIDESIDMLEVSRRIQIASQRVIDEIDAQRVLLAVEKGDLKVDNHILVSKDVLHDVVDIYEGQEVARQRILQIDEDSVTVSFLSDATLLRRILGNMVKNALEATPVGEVVKLGVDATGSGLSFWVQNGAVIPVSYQQRVFQRDFSTKGAGRGLGTYSMKLLGRFLSGDVNFTSQSTVGTRFTFTLPVGQ